LRHMLQTKHSDLRTLLTQPAFCKQAVRCYVVRHKSCMGGVKRFDFFMCISEGYDMYCFTAKDYSGTTQWPPYYCISIDPGNLNWKSLVVGMLRTDLRSAVSISGSSARKEYTLYEDLDSKSLPLLRQAGGLVKRGEKEREGLRRELLYVELSNSPGQLRWRSAGAVMVLVPRQEESGAIVEVGPVLSHTGQYIAERVKRGDKDNLMELKNREAKWDPVSDCHLLDFHGRATLDSCKNIQLHKVGGEASDVSFLMGKVEKNKFNVDFKGPFSCLQAFALALSVFDNS